MTVVSQAAIIVAAVALWWWRCRSHRIHRPWQRAVVRTLDASICVLCRRPVWPGANMDVDHLRAWSRGGLTSVWNAGCAHSRCNLRKGARVVPGLTRSVWCWRLVNTGALTAAVWVAAGRLTKT